MLCVLLAINSPLSWAEDKPLPPLDCVISPYQTVDLSSSVAGVLDKIYVEKSDFIAQGQVAASLEAGVEKSSVVLAKARADIQSEVEVSKVNKAFDQRRKERIDVLYEKKSVSFDTKDQAEREYNLSTWRLQQSLDLKNIRQLELRRAQEQLKQKTIRTPIDGYVLQVFKEAGEYVEDQPIMRIAQLDPLYVEAIVPIEFYGRIRAGMTAQVHPETNVQQPRVAVVTVVDKVGDAASGTFAVRLNLPNPDYQLPAGLKCSMKFTESGAVASSAQQQSASSVIAVPQ